MALSAPLGDFVSRAQALQKHRDSTDNLIKDMLIYCDAIGNELQEENRRLAVQLRDSTLDLSDATSSRRDLQQRLQNAEAANRSLSKENEELKNRNPYVLFLVDGDGLIFQEKWIKQGIDGGKKAAYALRSAVAEQYGHLGNDIEIVARVFANVMGLAKALVNSGTIDSINDFRDFILGFTQAKASFDFVDVGYGKERADSKIKEVTRWNLGNHNCKHILMGISHDSGYAPFLDEILLDDCIRRRITIIEGSPTARDLTATGVTVNTLESLFRSDKLLDKQLPDRPLSNSHAGSVSTMSVGRTPSPSNSTPLKLSSTSSVNSYAGVTSSASPPPVVSLPLPRAPKPSKNSPRAKQEYITVPAQQPNWKPGPRGLDEPITVSVAALDAIKKRKGTQKLCNNHFLRGPCIKDGCSFVHNYKPSDDEIRAIEVLSRQNPCSNGQYCEAGSCMYGHHCPSIKDGYCTHINCKFEESQHPPGTKFRVSTSRTF